LYLLWTERPQLLPREVETHAWMEAHRPWEVFGLTLIHDAEPGDWRHYSQVFRETWLRAGRERTGFINVESDVVPTMEAFQSVLECPELLCLVPYMLHAQETGKPIGHGATVEVRVPGGWDAHLAREGDERAEGGDLGFVKFGAGLVAGFPYPEFPELQFDNGLLNEGVYNWLRRKWRPEGLIHLHWPALKNNHVGWDDGDQRHHPPTFRPPWLNT